MYNELISIHDFRFDYLKLNLEKYNLSFDDGLFSQYFYWNEIKKIKTKKILSICSNLIGTGKPRNQFDSIPVEFPNTFKCLKLFRKNKNRENYMRISEIKRIKKDAIIAAHGHNHIYKYTGSLKDKLDLLKYDTEEMLEWFSKNLNIVPTIYTFPHYKEFSMMRLVLSTYGFNEFIGPRKEIEELL